MNASPRQRSSRRPSSHIRPQAVPVPSTLEYQSESSSHPVGDADGLQVRPRIGGVPSTRLTIITLPFSSPWSLAYPSVTATCVPSGESDNHSICQVGS